VGPTGQAERLVAGLDVRSVQYGVPCHGRGPFPPSVLDRLAELGTGDGQPGDPELIPTLLGLAGIDMEQAASEVAARHTEAQPLPGRDLSGLVLSATDAASIESPIYFMTEDDFTRGMQQVNILTGKPFEPVPAPVSIESVIATLPTGEAGSAELWKLNHYYDRLDDWYAAQGVAPNPFRGPAAESDWELHNLTADHEERHNRASDTPGALSAMKSVLEAERDAKRRIPLLRNAGA